MKDEEEFEIEFVDDLDFEFELLNSSDEKIITLVCRSERAMSPDEFAQALKSFADRIESIVNMADVSSGTIN